MGEIISCFPVWFPQLKMPLSSDYCRNERRWGLWKSPVPHKYKNQKHFLHLQHLCFETVSSPPSLIFLISSPPAGPRFLRAGAPGSPGLWAPAERIMPPCTQSTWHSSAARERSQSAFWASHTEQGRQAPPSYLKPDPRESILNPKFLPKYKRQSLFNIKSNQW